MCYSAGASFIAGAGLTTIGVASFRVADRKHKAFALIPLVFGIQQIIEGFQWISLGSGSVSFLAAYGFLFFAFLFWPIYVPITVFKLDEKRRKFLGVLVAVGIAVALFLLGALILEPLTVGIRGGSICYNIYMPFDLTASILYIIVTCGAFLISSKSELRRFGHILTASVIVSATFFFYAFTSVWCFFSAILSSLIYFYVRNNAKIT